MNANAMTRKQKLDKREAQMRGGQKGGMATGHKGFRAASPEKCREIWNKATLSKAVIAEAALPPEPSGAWLQARNATVAAISNPTSKRAYRNAIDYFVYWLADRPLTFNIVDEHEKHLRRPGPSGRPGRKIHGYADSSIVLRMAAIRGAIRRYISANGTR